MNFMPTFSFQKKTPKTLLFLSGAFLIILSFAVGYFAGGAHSARKLVPEGEGRVVSQGEAASDLSKNIDFNQFWDVWNYVKDTYHKQPVSDEDLYYGALKGVLSGLKDPYSVYFDPEEAKEFEDSLEGSFSGIGAEIGIKDDKLVIISPLAGSPAEKAGLQAGDWVVLINGAETTGMSVEKAVLSIRGEAGTEVVLTISRDGLSDVTEIKIVREKIEIDSVKWKIDDNNILRISISTFNHDTSGLFSAAVQEALTKNVKGIILDMRGNPGGLLTSAIDVASAWVGYKPVVIERGKKDARSFNGVIAPRLANIPTVVLVNKGSASGSEIVAGALQDYGLAKLVGMQTFGKGSVQDYKELKDGSAVKITTALWYTPKGRSINETGIEPDIKVEFTLEQYKKSVDPQLDTAIKVLLGTYEADKTANTQKATE